MGKPGAAWGGLGGLGQPGAAWGGLGRPKIWKSREEFSNAVPYVNLIRFGPVLAKLPGEALSRVQGEPGEAWGSLGQPGEASGSLGQPGAAWGGLGRPGEAWGGLGEPGEA